MSNLKYVDTLVTFSEIPDEISLCINISNCPHRCNGCHSPYLQEDIGMELNENELEGLICNNKGITVVCFMGGDNNIQLLTSFADIVHKNGLKVAWYSGIDYKLDNDIITRYSYQHFDYVKTGPYIKELGPLTSKTTNQRLYERISTNPYKFKDITYKFWKQ